MGRILFVTMPNKGHLNPIIGVAQWLRRLGHDVCCLCIPRPDPAAAAQLASSGIDTIGLPGALAPIAGSSGAELARLVRDPVAYTQRNRRFRLEMVEAYIEPIRQRIREYGPDVIALDGQLSAAVIAAHLESVPYAALCTTLLLAEPPTFKSMLVEIVASIADERAAMFARYGLAPEFRSNESVSPHLNVMFTTDALLGACELPAHTFLVGPTIPPAQRGDEPDFPWHRVAADRPIVYVSFGSMISWQPELFEKIAEAAIPLGVQLIMSTGELTGTDFVRNLPGEPICVEYVPQLAVLERAAAFVSHGGANSVMEAMYHGVPTLVVPLCGDAPLQGMFVEQAGVGIVMDPDRFTVEECRTSLRALIHQNGSHRHAAQKVRASYRANDGARQTAERIAALLERPRVT